MSPDDVADLIAAPQPDSPDLEDLPEEVASEVTQAVDMPPEYTDLVEVIPEPEVASPVEIEPTTETQPAIEAPLLEEPELEQPQEVTPTQPDVATPVVSFEPADPGFDDPVTSPVEEPLPPADDLDFPTEAPPPPLDPIAAIAEIEARIAAERMSAPPPGDVGEALRPEVVDEESPGFEWDTTPAAEPEVTAEAVASQRDPFDLHTDSPEDADTDGPSEPGFDESPAVVIPTSPPGDRPSIRTEVPKPMGAPQKPISEIPRPLDVAQQTTWTPTSPDAAAESAGELPPIDRLFRDPGLLGQATQLALILTAAISLAMVVAHIVLNNRLTDYATKGESVPRVESVESIIGTWLRPLLIVALIGVYLMTVMWSRRVVANLAVFDKPIPEAALWMWAIPLVNILVVHRHFDNAWKGSDVLLKDDPDWRKTRGNWWTLGFAVLSIAAIGVLFYGSVIYGIDVEGATGSTSALKTEGAIDSNAYLMIGYALVGGALLCLVRSISGIIERQHNRARHFV